MNAYHIMIQVCNSNPIIWRKIEISDQLSFQQLHEAIRIVFHWDLEKSAYFQIANQTLSMDFKNTYHYLALPLSTYLRDALSFTYVYGNSDEELWEVSLFASKITNDNASLKLLEFEQHHPIYGLGGVDLYQSISKEAKSISLNSSMQILLDRLCHPFHPDEIASYFANIIKRSYDKSHALHQKQFNQELQTCREVLQGIKLPSVSLILLHIQNQIYPCYIDVLDNGIEFMVFYDQNGFARSIINSISDDPDLLFTNALTIDFLHDESDATQLYLHDGRNLCFANRSGCLPRVPSDEDIILLTTILRQCIPVLQAGILPSLLEHKMLRVENGCISECPYEISEDICAVQLSKQETTYLSTLPHTNERITLNFTAVPGEHCEESKILDIHLIAQGNNYVKDEIMNVEHMPMLIDQLYHYLDELIHERCIPGHIHTNNINLLHMLQPYCDDLQIELHLFSPSSKYKGDLVSILANTLHLTPEELMMMDEYDNKKEAENIMYSDPYKPTKRTVAKLYN